MSLIRLTFLIVGSIWIATSCKSWKQHVRLQGYPLKLIQVTEPKNTTTLYIKDWEKNQLSPPTLSAKQQIYIAQIQEADSLLYQRYFMQDSIESVLQVPSYIVILPKKVKPKMSFGHTNTVGSTISYE